MCFHICIISEIGSQYSDEAFDDDFDDASSISSADKVSICSEGAKKSEHKHFVKGHRRNRSCDIKTILGNTPVRTVSIDDGYSSACKTTDSTPEALQLPSPLPNSVSTPMGLCSLPPASSQTQSQNTLIPQTSAHSESGQVKESTSPEKLTQPQQATNISTSSNSKSNLARKQTESKDLSGPTKDIPSPLRRSQTVAEFGDVANPTNVMKRVSSVGSDLSKLESDAAKDKQRRGSVPMNGLLPLSVPNSTAGGDNSSKKSAPSKLKVSGALPLLDFSTITKDRTLTF